MKILVKTFKNKVGATAIEYGLIAALISVAIIGTVGSLGKSLTATFSTVSSSISSANSGTGTTASAG
nr:Flp family type IVb pilin [uncultured Acetobacter sp.]